MFKMLVFVLGVFAPLCVVFTVTETKSHDLFSPAPTLEEKQGTKLGENHLQLRISFSLILQSRSLLFYGKTDVVVNIILHKVRSKKMQHG